MVVFERRVKAVVVGTTGLKTALCINYANGHPHEGEYMPHVFDNFAVKLTVGDPLVEEEVGFGLWDTAGQEDYDRLRPLSYPEADVMLLVFDMNDRDSYEQAFTKYLQEIRGYADYSTVIKVIGLYVNSQAEANVLRGKYAPKWEVTVEEARLRTYNETVVCGRTLPFSLVSVQSENLRDEFNQILKNVVLYEAPSSGSGVLKGLATGFKDIKEKSRALLLVSTMFQLASFPAISALERSDSDEWSWIPDVILLDFSFISPVDVLFISVAAAASLCLIFVPLGYDDTHNYFVSLVEGLSKQGTDYASEKKYKKLTARLVLFAQFSFNLGFMAICNRVFQAFDCTSANGTVTLDLDPSIICWKKEHNNLIIVTCLCSAPFLFLCVRFARLNFHIGAIIKGFQWFHWNEDLFKARKEFSKWAFGSTYHPLLHSSVVLSYACSRTMFTDYPAAETTVYFVGPLALLVGFFLFIPYQSVEANRLYFSLLIILVTNNIITSIVVLVPHPMASGYVTAVIILAVLGILSAIFAYISFERIMPENESWKSQLKRYEKGFEALQKQRNEIEIMQNMCSHSAGEFNSEEYQQHLKYTYSNSSDGNNSRNLTVDQVDIKIHTDEHT